MDKKQQLDEQMRAVMDKYKYKRRQIRELQDDLQVEDMLMTIMMMTTIMSVFINFLTI